jgi:hypothetical protein
MDTENTKQQEDIWSKFRPPAEDSKSLFYRYEGDGIVAYDSFARIYDEPSKSYNKPEKNLLNLKKKIEIIDVDEYGME